MPTIRVLVVDDNAAFRLVVGSVLKRSPGIEVVGEATNGEEAVASVGQVKPHVIVMDVNMPKMNGIEATFRIKSQCPGIAMIGLTINEDEATMAAMRQAGVFLMIKKESLFEDLLPAIRKAVGSPEDTETGESPGHAVESHGGVISLDDGLEGERSPKGTTP